MLNIPENRGSRYVANNETSSTIAILQRVKAGDPAAEEQLFTRFYQRLVRLAFSRVARNWHARIDPEDVVQSVLLSFFVRYKDGRVCFEAKNELWAFLTRLTICKCSDRIRHHLYQKRNLNREARDGDFENEVTMSVISREPTAEDIAVFMEIFDRLTSRLDDTQLEIVRLKLSGFSNVEISKKINRSERTIYRLLGELRLRMDEITRHGVNQSGDGDGKFQ